MEQLKLLDTVTPMRHPDCSNQPNYLGFPLTCDNFNYCKNRFMDIGGKLQILQAASLYFQSDSWKAEDMWKIMWDVSLTSLKVLSNSLPWKSSNE